MHRILFSPIAAILITVLLGCLSLSFYLNARHIQQSEHSVIKLEGEVEKIQTKVNQKVAEVIEATSSAAKEKMYRDQLLLQKPGEFVVQIPELPSPSPVVLPSPTQESPWRQWQKLLF